MFHKFNMACLLVTVAVGSPLQAKSWSVGALVDADVMTIDALVADALPIENKRPIKLYEKPIVEAVVAPVMVASTLIQATPTAVAAAPVAIVAAPESVPSVDEISQPAHVDEIAFLEDVATPEVEATKLIVRLDDQGRLQYEPKSLAWTGPGDVITVDTSALPKSVPLALFVRDGNLVTWNPEALTLAAEKQGETEIYLVSGKTMRIVPATIQGSQESLNVPAALTSLDGLFDQTNSQALYAGVPKATTRDSVVDPETKKALEESVAETERAQASMSQAVNPYGLTTNELSYGSLALQFMDERSAPHASLIYPLNDLKVRIVGTEFEAKTDATGHLVIPDVPHDSRLIVGYYDELERVKPGFAVVDTNQNGVRRITAYRTFAFDTSARIAQVVQTAQRSSVCFVVKQGDAVVSGIEVEVDMPADGPFYFNDLGYLDLSRATTGNDGRACFYNLDPGPYAVTLSEGEVPFVTYPLSALSGFHGEETLQLDAAENLNVYLASTANAHEQLADDPSLAQKMTPIDAIDLLPIATAKPMAQRDFGWLSPTDPLYYHDSRVQVLSQAAEFESVLYSLDPHPEAQVLPLLPRGFVEDLSLYAQESYDPSLGVVLVEHGALAGQGNDQIELKLMDMTGQAVEGGWYFADAPVTKAMFFNVPTGTYLVMSETATGYWLAADIVRVYNETVSYVRLGSRTGLVE